MSHAACQVNDLLSNAALRLVGAIDERWAGGPTAAATGDVLVVDAADCLPRAHLRRAFPSSRYRVQWASSAGGRLQHVRPGSHDAVVVCLNSPGSSGLEVCHQVRRLDERVPVIVVAGSSPGRADVAIEAMKQGAYDFLFRPVDLGLLERVVADALDVSRGMRGPHAPAAAPEAADPLDDEMPIGGCPAMCDVYKAIGRVANQNMPVLITGESGTGKEVVARALCRNGSRAHAPFLALNCAAIPAQLLESELFGHEKGAFTGADRRRVGKFEQCDGGTLLLDEIGDMPLALQAKMLRVLQEQAFERVGGNETVRTNVRLIAATHRDLKALSEQGNFRRDLYYRLGVFTIHLPALRDRGDDLPLLVRHYLRRLNRELLRDVSPDAMDRLRAYAWPGNVRELQSVMKQAMLRATGHVLLAAFLPDLPAGGNGNAAASQVAGVNDRFPFEDFIRQRLAAGSTDLHSEVLLQLDRILLPAVLRFTSGSQHQAARTLGVARQTLRSRLRDLGIGVAKTVETEDILTG